MFAKIFSYLARKALKINAATRLRGISYDRIALDDYQEWARAYEILNIRAKNIK